MSRAGGGVIGGLCATGDGEGSKFLGASAEGGGIPRVRSGSHSELTSDTLSDPEWRGSGRPVDPPPPHPPQGGPELPVLLPKTLIEAPVPDSGVPRRGVKSDQPPDPIFAPERAGYNCDPGGR